ncbi:carboxypeptidase M32 [Candidatus Neomarinimicrobiota bacterium]
MTDKLNNFINELIVIAQLRRVAALLNWDQETYMPVNGGFARGEQLSLILSLAHTRFIGSEFEKSLGQLVDLESGNLTADGIDERQGKMVQAVWRDWSRAKKIPTEFVAKFAVLTSESQQAWFLAKEDNDFPLIEPYLVRIVEMKRQEAEYVGYKTEPYDALLEDFEPDISTGELIDLFEALLPTLRKLVQDIDPSKNPYVRSILTQEYDEQRQWDFSLRVLRDMGFDMSRGRLDQSKHPFTTDFHPSDVRITTRLNPSDFASGFFGSIHEGGHALYEQGMDERHFGTPLAEAISLGVHESQSRLWENYVGRSREFWQFYFPRLQRQFQEQLGAVTLDAFYRAINAVQPTPIRVEADEVTYNLHIILRFELERALINGDARVSDLPDLWNGKMEQYLGLTPKDDTTGLLQDIHWSIGAFGYFPTYTLGNIYGRQIFEAALTDMDDLPALIAKGDLLTLRKWLREKVHTVGRIKTPKELIKSITGNELSVKPFLTYLVTKYKEIYQF